MADVWKAYVTQFGIFPKDASQLQQFTKTNADQKALTFTEARSIFDANAESNPQPVNTKPPLKPVITPTTSTPTPSKPVITPTSDAKPSLEPIVTKTKTTPSKPMITPASNSKPPLKPVIANPTNTAAPSQPNISDKINAKRTSKPMIANTVNTKPIVHKPMLHKPLPAATTANSTKNKDEVKRQLDECVLEQRNLKSIESDFEDRYQKRIQDISDQFQPIYDALQKREQDLKNWRKQEYDEGLKHIHQNQNILQQRVNELQNNNNINHQTLYKIPKLNDFHLHQFTRQSLQIQNALNIIFQLGPTYQQNTHNTTLISFKMNRNPANTQQNIKSRMDKHELDFGDSPFGKGKVYSNTTKRPPKPMNNVQANGTKTLQFTDNDPQNKIRGFDIGNNAKYGVAQQMAKNTNALPSNFWESGDDTDSEEERKETQREIVNRWKTQKTNIVKNAPKTPQKRHSVYDDDETSSEEEEADDGFEKYLPPVKTVIAKPPIVKAASMACTTQWIVDQQKTRHAYDTMWFKLPKMRNGKASGVQMKPYLEKSGLNNEQLKQIWRLSDLDKDGKMGNEEFVLCMFLIDQVKNGANIPQTLPKNYIPPSFRGKRKVKTPIKRKPLPSTAKLNGADKRMSGPKVKPDRKAPMLGAQVNTERPAKPKYLPPKPKAKAEKPQIQTKQPVRVNQTTSPFGSKQAQATQKEEKEKEEIANKLGQPSKSAGQ
eukprot:79062_1